MLCRLYAIVNGACHLWQSTVLLSVILINGACHIWQGNISVIVKTYYSSSTFFSARYSSRSFCHRAMNEVSKRAA